MKTFKTFNNEKDLEDFEEDIAAQETETSSDKKEKQEEKNENV
jgi:hypothetical protein|tara:strand:+ start:8043 stop:8171 length:129 start_codon:yes stop_codon:yes gene_type:complete